MLKNKKMEIDVLIHWGWNIHWKEDHGYYLLIIS